jgi:hypothetical protein
MNPKDQLKGYLTLPSDIVNHHTRTLLRRRGKPNMPQFLFDKFDGDDLRTRFWLEDIEGETKLMSQYGNRPLVQEVITPAETKELFEREGANPVHKSQKVRIMELFEAIGCDPDTAHHNAHTFMSTIWDTSEDNKTAKRMIATFLLMKEAGIKAETCRLLGNGHLLMSVEEAYKDKMVEISEKVGFQNASVAVSPKEETSEDPVV